MATKRNTLKSVPAPAPKADDLPQYRLDQLAITWEPEGHWFRSTQTPARVGIKGAELAALLGWLARSNHPHGEPFKLLGGFGHPSTIALHLQSLGELLEAVSASENIGEYAGGATYALSAIIRDYANRLTAADTQECAHLLETAVVTVCDPAEEAQA